MHQYAIFLQNTVAKKNGRVAINDSGCLLIGYSFNRPLSVLKNEKLLLGKCPAGMLKHIDKGSAIFVSGDAEVVLRPRNWR